MREEREGSWQFLGRKQAVPGACDLPPPLSDITHEDDRWIFTELDMKSCTFLVAF